MIEIFSGTATLCSVAKQFGMTNSLALDKIRKRGSKTTIFVFDITKPESRELLMHWLESNLVCWVHMAPVCGTCSRAREIDNGGPPPLRSDDFPMGLPGLNPDERCRVQKANELYLHACLLFEACHARGILVTMENPSYSIFWLTDPFVALLNQVELSFTNFQMCMLGGARPKWTRLAANFHGISEMDLPCDNSHKHLPWGKVMDDSGRWIFATSEEAQYPRKMCVALVECVLRQLQKQGLQMVPSDLSAASNQQFFAATASRISADNQPRKSKLPPLVPEHSSVAVFYADEATDVGASLLTKLPSSRTFYTDSGASQSVPVNSKFLRRSVLTDPPKFWGSGTVEQSNRGKCVELAFGLPWSCEDFIRRAVDAGHPTNFCKLIPADIDAAVTRHATEDFSSISQHRLDWCKRWLKRAIQLDKEEKKAASSRSAATGRKRLMLTREILTEMDYEDMESLNILQEGSPLAGAVPHSEVFRSSFKPCLSTLRQLETEAPKRNSLVLSMVQSAGDPELDRAVLEETQQEVARGWADGPWELGKLEKGATISRRFPIRQGAKIRLIDDYSASGVNDSCAVHTKVDLHAVDTFIGVVKSFFEKMSHCKKSSSLVAKTYDLKSAYRQIPIKESHLKFGYFCIYNHLTGKPEIFRSLSLPFGATHSVYSFLRLARMLHAIATRQLFLITTNFFDDFILASPEGLSDSSAKSLEVLFLLTGWDYATEGKKATSFNELCHALGVTFDLSLSSHGTLQIRNTESRLEELCESIQKTLTSGKLSKLDTMRLRGRLGFADGFVHGRLGALLLKRLMEHAYSHSTKLDDEVTFALQLMLDRLKHAGPKKVGKRSVVEWFVFTDAAFETDTCLGGLGAVLVDSKAVCRSWFGMQLSADQCELFGAKKKGTIIYELEMLAACLSMELWKDSLVDSFPVLYVDNDGVRQALVRGVASGTVANTVLQRHLRFEVNNSTSVWFARVPSEANIADWPSRGKAHPFFAEKPDDSKSANTLLIDFMKELEDAVRQVQKGEGDLSPRVPKRRSAVIEDLPHSKAFTV